MKESIIDTDILSYYMKGNQDVIEKFVDYLNQFPTITIADITYYEILKGFEYKNARRKISGFEKFAKRCTIVNTSLESLKISSNIFGHLKRMGNIIGTSDILIAGIAIENNLKLITNNLKHFENVDGLEIESWKKNR